MNFKTGKSLRLERVLATKNDASLGLRLAQVEGKGRGVMVACLIFHALFVFRLLIFPPQTTRRFEEGEPVVEYKGTLLSHKDAKVSFGETFVQDLSID